VSTTLQRVRRAFWRVWQQDVSVRPSGAWTDLDGLVCHATGLPHRQWNGAILTAKGGLARLPEARAWFAARELPWGLLVPEELSLEPPGMTHVTGVRLMTRDLSGLAPVPEFDLRWDEPATAADVQDAAFADPIGTNLPLLETKPLTTSSALVTAYEGDSPVSTATLAVADGVAVVFGVGTVPTAQRHGYGGAVTLAVLHRAASLGCDLAMLNPTDAGHALYARLGFSDGPPWEVWTDTEASGVSLPGR